MSDLDHDLEDKNILEEDDSDHKNSEHTKSSPQTQQKPEEIVITKEFQENVINFVKYDDEINKKQEELKELKKKKKPCEEFILKYLDLMGENIIQISNGKLTKNKKETKSSINADIMKKAIFDKVKDEKLTEDILKSMENMRTINSEINIKRVGEKKNNNAKTKKNQKKKKK